jgi:hypothetical protein
VSSNSSLSLTSLDFDTIKSSLRTFLKTQDLFKDYDFDGPNISVLLDVLSYNTYLNSFYLNMLGSEMFMDSAQTYASVVSHAKDLNYTPQSRRSAQVTMDVTFNTSGLNGRLIIPEGTLFTGSNPNGSYTFVTSTTETYTSANDTYTCTGVDAYEGTYVEDTYVLDWSISSQSFVLTNSRADITSLIVTVVEDDVSTIFKRFKSLFGVNADTNAYFVQPYRDAKYEFLFGDGVFGRKPKNGAVIRARYRVTNGSDANGVASLDIMQDLGPINGGVVDVSAVTVTSNSAFGSMGETIEDVKFRAPRWYATQERAISNDDYRALVMANFGASIQDVAVFGGQEVEPKEYGRVILAVKPFGSTVVSDRMRADIIGYLYDKSQMSVEVRDCSYLYLNVESTVTYDPTSTSLYAKNIRNQIIDSVLDYSTASLEKFGADFRYSRLVHAIDTADDSVVSNDTTIRISKRLIPTNGGSYTTSFSYDNPIFAPGAYVSYADRYYDEPSITSSEFTYTDKNGVQYQLCRLRDDRHGGLTVYNYVNGVMSIIAEKIGTVDYSLGNVSINSMTLSNFGQYLTITMRPAGRDVSAKKSNIIVIDPAYVTVNVVTGAR